MPIDGTPLYPPPGAGQDFDRVVCADVIPAVRQQPFCKGDRISTAERGNRSVTTVALGALRLESILHDGRRQVLGFFLKGEALQRVRPELDLRCIALANGILYTVRETDLNRCGDCHFTLESANSRPSQAWVERLAAQNILLGRCTATERIASFLVDIAARIGIPRDNGITVILPMKRDDIADYLGLNAETVSRQLSKLRTAGLLDLPKPGHLRIKDPDALSRLSPFNGPANAARRSDAA